MNILKSAFSKSFYSVLSISFILTVLFAAAGMFPVAAQQPKPEEKVLIDAQTLQYRGAEAVAEGEAVLTYTEGIVKADRIVYNETSGSVEAEGNVHISRPGEDFFADRATYNIFTDEGHMENGKGSSENIEQNDQKIQGRLYFWGDVITKDSKSIKIKNAVITTCDVPRPKYHYHIETDNAEIIPGDKLIANKVRLKIKNRQLFYYPRLVMGLDGKTQQQQLIPRIGSNSNDGWYVKEKVPFQLFGYPGKASLDWYENTGVGTGLDYSYMFNNQRGHGGFHWYNLSPSANAWVRDEFSNNPISQPIGKKEFGTNIHYNFDNSYYAGGAYSSDELAYPKTVGSNTKSSSIYVGRSTETQSFLLQQTQSDYNVYSYITRRADYARKLGDRFKFRFRGYQSENTGDTFSNKDLWRYNGELTYEGNSLDSVLTFTSSSSNFVYSFDRIPELNVYSKNLSLWSIPLQAIASVGNYEEHPTALKMARSAFYLGTEPIVIDLGEKSQLNIAAGYEQIYNEDKSARYVLNGITGISHRLSENMAVKANYYYQKPYGYSPFLNDYRESYNMAAGGLEFFNEDHWKFSLLSGYDFQYGNSHNLIGSMAMKATDKMWFKLGSGYNTDVGGFQSLNGQISLDLGEGLGIEYWCLYDLTTGKSTYQDIALSKETHDFFTKLIYRRLQKELWLQFELKAFPGEEYHVGPSKQRIPIPEYK